jgi:hypothetical protein
VARFGQRVARKHQAMADAGPAALAVASEAAERSAHGSVCNCRRCPN